MTQPTPREVVIFADESCQGNCLCEPDYECDYCGSQLAKRIAEHNADWPV